MKIGEGWLHWSEEYNLPKDVDNSEQQLMESVLMVMMHLHLNLHLSRESIKQMVDYKIHEINHIFPQMMDQFPAWDNDGTKPNFDKK